MKKELIKKEFNDLTQKVLNGEEIILPEALVATTSIRKLKISESGKIIMEAEVTGDKIVDLLEQLAEHTVNNSPIIQKAVLQKAIQPKSKDRIMMFFRGIHGVNKQNTIIEG